MFNEDTDNMLLQLQRLTQGSANTAGQMAAQAPAGTGAMANIQGRQQAGAAQAQAQAAAQQYAQQQAALMKLAMHFFGA